MSIKTVYRLIDVEAKASTNGKLRVLKIIILWSLVTMGKRWYTIPALSNGEPTSGTDGIGELYLTGSTKFGEQGTCWQVGEYAAMHVAH